MSRILLISVVLQLLFTVQLSAAESFNPQKSVVMIRSTSQDFSYSTPWKLGPMTQGVGSGLVIRGNRILTNAHNVSNVKFIEVKLENRAKRFVARVEFIGHDCDLALLAVDDESFFSGTVPLEIGDLPQINTLVSTYGFPLGGSRISATQGVISRIDVETYAHSAGDSHLVIQTDAAINPGNSGGPVIQDGKVIGVAFQGLRQAENIGFMIPTTIIKHFLADVNDGKYDGFGALGAILFPGLHNENYKAWLKVPADQEGVVVTDVLMHGAAESVLQKNDVLTQVDDHKIDNDGRVEMYGFMLPLDEAIESKQIGQKIQLTYYRDGKMMQSSVPVLNYKPVVDFVQQFDMPPRYICFAGLVFMPLNRNYLETWGQEWQTSMPSFLRYLFVNSMQLNTDKQRKEYVVLAEIMPDQINSYGRDFMYRPIKKINGIDIEKLDDVNDVFAKPAGDFHVIEFIDSDRQFVIDAKTAAARQPQILSNYNIPASSNL